MHKDIRSTKKVSVLKMPGPPFRSIFKPNLLLFVGFALTFLMPLPATAQLLPADEWTRETKLRLAQAMIGEAGWKKREDWALIAWVIHKRRRNRLKNGYSTTYLKVLQGYSIPVKPSLATLAHIRRSKRRGNKIEHRRALRRRFLQSIAWDGSNLEALRKAYRRHSDLEEMQRGWEAAKATVEAWGRGEIPDKCRSALHWGHPEVRTDVIRVCKHLHTSNYFYRNPKTLKRARRPGETVVVTPSSLHEFVQGKQGH